MSVHVDERALCVTLCTTLLLHEAFLLQALKHKGFVALMISHANPHRRMQRA